MGAFCVKPVVEDETTVVGWTKKDDSSAILLKVVLQDGKEVKCYVMPDDTVGDVDKRVRALYPVYPSFVQSRGRSVRAHLRAETDHFSASGRYGGLHQIAADVTIEKLLEHPRRQPYLAYSPMSDMEFRGSEVNGFGM